MPLRTETFVHNERHLCPYLLLRQNEYEKGHASPALTLQAPK